MTGGDSHHLSAVLYHQRCQTTLELALNNVPAYRAWQPLDPGPTCPIDARYAALPLLTKHDMRVHGPSSFVSPGLDLRKALEDRSVELVSTSGTTGEQVENTWYQPWWDRSEHASWRLNAHAAAIPYEDHREAILTGPRPAGILCEDGTLDTATRTNGRILYLNEMPTPERWTPALMDRMLDELAACAPPVLEANPSLLARLCRHARAANRPVYQPSLIVLTYENPSRLGRRIIAEVFDAPVASSYGSTEAGYVCMECEHGSLHQVTESCRVDLLPFGRNHEGRDVYHVAATTFDNPWRILVRFDMGDLALVRSTPCACGRTAGVVLESIEGRVDNVTYGSDGRMVTPGDIDRAIATVPGVFDYTLAQTRPGVYDVRVIPDTAVASDPAPAVRAALHDLYGPLVVEVRVVESFPPGRSGKFRRVRVLSLDA